ncbi:MAG: MarR family transcriptional regulator [Chloroflexi bacterium]|nr:MarR family transcriptional regulator [Chloroflexota bacterium]
MNLLDKEIITQEASISTPEECAREVLEVVPTVMRAIRTEMRSRRNPDLSVPQFRTLGFLNRHEGASLSDVAEHIGMTLPSMSKLVDGLVSNCLATRQVDARDRRRVTLTLTEEGKIVLKEAREATQTRLAETLGALPARERALIIEAMEALRGAFTSNP